MISPLIDLSQLPPPEVVQRVDPVALLSALRAKWADLWPVDLSPADPAAKLIELMALEIALLQQRVNDAAHGVMLAYAGGANLDQLGALLGVARLPGELDPAFRARIQLAPHGFSTAGPVAAYRYHAMRAHPDVRAVAVDSPSPGQVRVIVLSKTGDGTPSPTAIDAVSALLRDDDVRPLNDQVSVVPAEILPYAVTARIELDQGPDPGPVLSAADAAVRAYISARHGLGEVVATTGLIAALHVPGVRRVALASPTTDIVCRADQAPWCQSVTLSVGGI